MNPTQESNEKEGLSLFEKYLVIWIALCIVAGLLLAQFVPGIADAIDAMTVGTVSVPIGICLFLMMYPAVMNIKVSELRKIKKNPLPIIMTLFSNWIVAPLVGALLAGWLLGGNEELVVAVILLHASPCTAMVLVWGYLAGGNQEQNVVNTSINTVTIIFLYAPVVGLLIGLQNIAFSATITVDWIGLLVAAAIFIGLPILAGYLSKKALIARKGETWFNDVYKKRIGVLAMVALLVTLVVLFALNGDQLIPPPWGSGNPLLLVQVSIPLLLSFAIVVSFNVLITRLLKFKYREAIVTVLIGSSSHFEIAIASAITLYGVGSVAAMGTTMGLFWEVPVMLALVYFGRWLGMKRFWPPNEDVVAEKKDKEDHTQHLHGVWRD
ncbi:MAG: ACR3 family arsenite efflux transporter [Candidatus Lokiarchaeota archaeon]|nr:ACR3 family arsenite efflux transporter [Candidatus Lokiarchaeota archaeon]